MGLLWCSTVVPGLWCYMNRFPGSLDQEQPNYYNFTNRLITYQITVAHREANTLTVARISSVVSKF